MKSRLITWVRRKDFRTDRTRKSSAEILATLLEFSPTIVTCAVSQICQAKSLWGLTSMARSIKWRRAMISFRMQNFLELLWRFIRKVSHEIKNLRNKIYIFIFSSTRNNSLHPRRTSTARTRRWRDHELLPRTNFIKVRQAFNWRWICPRTSRLQNEGTALHLHIVR